MPTLSTLPPQKSYVIILVTGLEDEGKRATLAFSTACSALALEARAYLFLAGNGSYWAYEGHTTPVQQAGFPALAELVNTYLELGGQLYLCSTCDKTCGLSASDKSSKRLSGVELRGLASILDCAEHSTTMTF
ncbi:MAG TPA: DsrE family protein [Thiolinea sp.]|nr:DsrE family protein [Thiolinea sp.]